LCVWGVGVEAEYFFTVPGYLIVKFDTNLMFWISCRLEALMSSLRLMNSCMSTFHHLLCAHKQFCLLIRGVNQ